MLVSSNIARESILIMHEKVVRIEMAFAHTLVKLRTQRKMSQLQLSEAINIHVSQIRRYEAGKTQPTLDVLRNLALALNCTTDDLIFGPKDREPREELKLQLEAISAMSDEEVKLARDVLDGLILRHQAKRWTHVS